MAMIGTLRDKMGTWVVIFVFVAISAFILGDLFSNNSFLFNDNKVGEIAGNTITREEYQAAIEEREANYIINFQRRPGDRESINLRQEAWELLVLRNAIQKQFDELGIEVTMAEVEDMLYGSHVDENLKQTPLFQNPSTGEFDRAKVRQYMGQLANPPDNSNEQMLQMWQEQRTRWELFQRDLAPSRKRLKYENLILKSNYVTTAEAEKEYHNQTDVAELKYLYIPYYSVSDTAVEVADDDLRTYYNDHIERFKTEATRDLKFVSFPLVASAEDSASVMDEMKRIAEELTQTEDDSAVAASATDGANPFAKYNAGQLPDFIDAADLRAGYVGGPILHAGRYKVFKVSSVTKDTVYSARASHILIRWEDETDAAKREAKAEAQNILKEIKAGADFAAKAREHGTDASASRGGDLGWFTSGTMVKAFEDPVFRATRPGLVNELVETEYGYHIISVTDTKDNTAYEIALVEIEISPSDATTNATYRAAESFLSGLSDEGDFVEKAKEQGLNVQEVKNLKAGDRRVGALGDARQVVQWVFRDAAVGDISQVFEIQNEEYAVAVMTGKTDEGYRPMEMVREEIMPEVRKKLKGEIIKQKVAGQDGTLEEIAAVYGEDAGVYSSSDLKLNSNTLPSAGFDPKAVGVAFSLENGKRSEPFAGESGVLIIELENKTIAPSIEDYSAYKLPLQQTAQSRGSFNIIQAIKDASDIEDQRYKFY